MTYPDGYRDDEEDDLDEEDDSPSFRQWTCTNCFCDFYLTLGISPSFCPHCGMGLQLPPGWKEGAD